MKKTILLVLASLFILSLAYAGPRVYTQSVRDMDGNDFPDVTNPSSQTAPGYELKAWVVGRESEIISNLPYGTHAPAQMRLFRFGNGTTAPYQTRTAVQMGSWPTPWESGEIVHFEITNHNVDPAITDFWEIVIPAGTGSWTVDEIVMLDLWGDDVVTYTLNLTTNPVGHIISPDPVEVEVGEDPEALWGTYAPTSNPEGPGEWVPPFVVIDAETPWVEGEDGNYTYGFEFVWTTPPPTYTLNLSTDPAGHITSPAPTTNVEDLYGTYAPTSNPEGDGYWQEPASVVIDAETPWVEGEDGNFKYDVLFTWISIPDEYVDNYRVKVVTTPEENRAFALDGVPVNTTPYTTDYVLDKADFYGVWTVTDATDCWYHPVEIDATTVFTEVRAKGADGRAIINRYFEYTINFEKQEYHSYVIVANDADSGAGIAGAAVWFDNGTDPAVQVGTTGANGEVTFLCPGNYPGAGTYWVEMDGYCTWDPENVVRTEAFLTENLLSTFVGTPCFVPTYTLILTTDPEGHIESPEPSEDPADLYGEYAPTSNPAGPGHWIPSELVIDEDTPWVLGEDGNYTYTFNFVWDNGNPVELSAFTATLTGDFFVNVAWTSQTETQMMGYRVYRNTSVDQNGAMLIDHPMVPATNTSETQTYNVKDTDVMVGTTYYYWLEAVEYNTSNFHGPVSVTVTGNVPPVLPEVTSMKNAYPNPFKAGNSTNIEVALKAGETGSLTIYNVMGQVVKTVSLTEGSHTVNWNGRDSKGGAVGSGIYFYKLSTPSLNQTKKMVIVK